MASLRATLFVFSVFFPSFMLLLLTWKWSGELLWSCLEGRRDYGERQPSGTSDRVLKGATCGRARRKWGEKRCSRLIILACFRLGYQSRAILKSERVDLWKRELSFGAATMFILLPLHLRINWYGKASRTGKGATGWLSTQEWSDKANHYNGVGDVSDFSSWLGKCRDRQGKSNGFRFSKPRRAA
jgi:hypothetical protein